jgi:hypothetical protein
MFPKIEIILKNHLNHLNLMNQKFLMFLKIGLILKSLLNR